MTCYNTEITLDIQNLHRPRRTMQVMQFCGTKLFVRAVPADAIALSVVVFKPTGKHYAPIPLRQDANGDWQGFVIGTCFPDAGEAKYQLQYTDAENHICAGGKGKIIIDPFDPAQGGEPTPSGDVVITEIPSKTDGTMHKIVAVNKGTAENPDWTTELLD